MLHSLEHVGDHQNPLADTPTLVSCQAPQLGRPRFAAEKVCRHPPSPKHGTLAYQLYHIWGSPEAGITRRSGTRTITDDRHGLRPNQQRCILGISIRTPDADSPYPGARSSTSWAADL